MYEYRYPRRIYVGYFENETGESWASIRDAMGFSADPEPLIEDAVQYVRKDVADELLEALEASRKAINTLDEDALGMGTREDGHGGINYWPFKVELLHQIDTAIAKAKEVS